MLVNSNKYKFTKNLVFVFNKDDRLLFFTDKKFFDKIKDKHWCSAHSSKYSYANCYINRQHVSIAHYLIDDIEVNYRIFYKDHNVKNNKLNNIGYRRWGE